MRTLTIQNYSQQPPRLLATVALDDDGQIRIIAPDVHVGEHLAHGILVKTRTRLMPTDGEAFFNQVLREFSGAYVRAVES